MRSRRHLERWRTMRSKRERRRASGETSGNEGPSVSEGASGIRTRRDRVFSASSRRVTAIAHKRRAFSYACTSHYTKGVCSHVQQWPMEALDREVLAAIAGDVLRPDLVDDVIAWA